MNSIADTRDAQSPKRPRSLPRWSWIVAPTLLCGIAVAPILLWTPSDQRALIADAHARLVQQTMKLNAGLRVGRRTRLGDALHVHLRWTNSTGHTFKAELGLECFALDAGLDIVAHGKTWTQLTTQTWLEPDDSRSFVVSLEPVPEPGYDLSCSVTDAR